MSKAKCDRDVWLQGMVMSVYRKVNCQGNVVIMIPPRCMYYKTKASIVKYLHIVFADSIVNKVIIYINYASVDIFIIIMFFFSTIKTLNGWVRN